MLKCNCERCRAKMNPTAKAASDVLNAVLARHGYESPQDLEAAFVQAAEKMSQQVLGDIIEDINKELQKMSEDDDVRKAAVALFEATQAFYLILPFTIFCAQLDKGPGEAARLAVNAAIELEKRREQESITGLLSAVLSTGVKESVKKVAEANGPDN